MNYPYQFPYQPQNTIPQAPQSGFVTVHSEDEALRYPIAPGNSITFKIEGQPTIIEKSMGFSQLESPKIEKFKLVKADAPQETPPPKYALAADLDRIDAEIKRIKSMLPRRDRRKDDE